MNNFIPLSIPNIEGNEWKYVKECLDTGWVSSVGKFVDRFEDEICRYTGSSKAVACVNGTAALHTALIVAGVGSQDEVIVPTLTFIATVNVVSYVGAYPFFMDCDDSYNIDVEKTLDFLNTQCEMKGGFLFNRGTGRRIRALMPVHVFGHAVDLEPLMKVCREKNVVIVEDAAESLGTRYTRGPLEGRHTGTLGSLGCLSFNGNKVITTGGGGMILIQDENLACRARHLTTQAKKDEVFYLHDEIGFNYRMTNMTAAMGVAQLEKLPEYILSKKRNFESYQKLLAPIEGLSLVSPPDFASHNYWMYPLRIEKKKYGKDRDAVMELLAKNNIQARPLWGLNHLQGPYQNAGSYKIEKAQILHSKTLNIPCSAGLKPEELHRVVKVLS